MTKIIHRAKTRGEANHGWLHSFHTFSFGSYHNPERNGFGALRVLNDDVVQPEKGFGTHPHDNMEIVSIPLSGLLEHKDSMGNIHTIRTGEVQAITAGSGITHSEYNGSDIDPVNFLQIWILPKEKNAEPRYSQNLFPSAERINKFQLIVSPDGRENSLRINQDAYFSLATIEPGESIEYTLHESGNGIYLFVLEGHVKIEGEELGKRDAVGFVDISNTTIQAVDHTEILCIEVPMD